MARFTNVSNTPVQVSIDGATVDVGGTADDLDPSDEFVARAVERGALFRHADATAVDPVASTSKAKS